MVVHEQCFRCTLYLQIIKQNLKLFLSFFFSFPVCLLCFVSFRFLCIFISNKGERLNVEAFLFPRLNVKKNKQANKNVNHRLDFKKGPNAFPLPPLHPKHRGVFFKIMSVINICVHFFV